MVADSVRASGGQVLGSQIGVWVKYWDAATQTYRRAIRYIDLLVRDAGGQLLALEVKTGGATRDSTQVAKDLALHISGGSLTKSGATKLGSMKGSPLSSLHARGEPVTNKLTHSKLTVDIGSEVDRAVVPLGFAKEERLRYHRTRQDVDERIAAVISRSHGAFRLDVTVSATIVPAVATLKRICEPIETQSRIREVLVSPTFSSNLGNFLHGSLCSFHFPVLRVESALELGAAASFP